MIIPNAIIKGTLIRRYKRFLADVKICSGNDIGQEITVHIANPGSMLTLARPDAVIWLSHANNPKRKLQYSWHIEQTPDGHYVGVDTSLTNKIAEEALVNKTIPELADYQHIQREVKYSTNSRIDFLLTGDGLPDCYVEVKNVTLKRDEGNNTAEFPDSVTKRGTKHLNDLSAEVDKGNRAVMLYIVQRDDCDKFKLANDIDPAYAAAFSQATENGVEALCYGCTFAINENNESASVTLGHPIDKI